MRFGVNLLNFGAGADPGALLRWATVAEDLGFDALLISDHIAVTPDVHERYPDPFYEPFTALAYLAGVTRRIELGTTVLIVPYRHPLQTAKVTANIDRLSGGRLVLGVGVGWARQEFAALGVPFERQGAITDDYLAALRDLWTSDVASHDGPFVQFSDVHIGPRPVRTPHPPLWIGGVSAAALRRTVRFGDAWHPLRGTFTSLRNGLARIREMAEQQQRPVPAFVPRIPLHLTDAPLGGERLPGQGNLDQVRADIEGLRELGATMVVLDTYLGGSSGRNQHQHGWSTLEQFADKVVDLTSGIVR